jgi:hypothetical protein
MAGTASLLQPTSITCRILLQQTADCRVDGMKKIEICKMSTKLLKNKNRYLGAAGTNYPNVTE